MKFNLLASIITHVGFNSRLFNQDFVVYESIE